MKYAAIDIGTNTVLLLVAELKNGRLRVLENRQQIPRLGQGVDKEKNLSNDAMQRVINVLLTYRQLLQEKYPGIGKTVVTATSAVRDAGNGQAFLDEINRRAGFKVSILSGLDEARYTYLGAQSVFENGALADPVMALDIGGGSTEMAVGQGIELVDSYSFDMGCVRFTERFFADKPADEAAITSCKNTVIRMLDEHPFDLPRNARLLGVSGTVTSLAYMDQDMEAFDRQNIDGYKLLLEDIRRQLRWIRQAASSELIERYPVVMEGRADIFLAGVLILEGVMEYYRFTELLVSTGGIRHGALVLETQQ